MEDSFRVRVDKVFGSLSASSLSSASPCQGLSSSLWSLTDEEVEKREWNRDAVARNDGEDDAAGVPSIVDGFFSKRNTPEAGGSCSEPGHSRKELENELEELEDEDVAEDDDADQFNGCVSSSSRAAKPEDCDEDEWEVRNSIGMDCTLDFEEEEDEYDKVAVGREKAGERIYMRDVTDYTPHVNSHMELPCTLRKVSKDPRANHLAAKLRLREDAEAAGNFNNLRVSDEAANNAQVVRSKGASEDGDSPPKPILKRKERTDTKSEKRVRFDPSCKNEEDPGGDEGALRTDSKLPGKSSQVPDYMLNPSKYTHYTFESSDDMDEASNRQAYMDLFNILMKSKQSGSEEAPADLSKPVIFNPKKKEGDASSSRNSNEQNKEVDMEDHTQKRNLLNLASFGSIQEDVVSAMEEDVPVTEAGRKKGKKARQYRSKVNPEAE